MVELNLERTLGKILDRQWALADIDWDAPGADRIDDELHSRLKPFMADLVWVEHIGGRAFAALARKAEDPTLAEIYRYFHAEEQRHANAELALMRRWDMLDDDDEPPPPNVSLRYAIAWLDHNADDLPLSVLASTIPLLEVALDGALLKFLTDAVEDPLCQAVFDKVNNDESRHLAVGFHVMDLIGATPLHRQLRSLAVAGRNPSGLLELIGALPVLVQVRGKVVDAGLDERRLAEAIGRFATIGANGAHTENNVMFRLLRASNEILTDPRHPFHHVTGAVAAVSNRVPAVFLPNLPSWAGTVTHRVAS